MKILIVEDEIIPASYLSKLLSAEGYEVIEPVEKGIDAIQVSKNEKPDIILMDVMLDDNISGCDAALEISKHSPNILIIFLTAYSDKEMIDFAVDSKAFGYLLKPYRDKEILATVALASSHIKSLAKKNNNTSLPTSITLIENYTFHVDKHALFHHSKKINLGPKALDLIALLCKNRHRSLPADTIINILWTTSISTQALRSLIYRIRELTTAKIILNNNKTGYQINLTFVPK